MTLLLDSKTKPSNLEETRLGTRKQKRNHKNRKNHESGPRQTTNTKIQTTVPRRRGNDKRNKEPAKQTALTVTLKRPKGLTT